MCVWELKQVEALQCKIIRASTPFDAPIKDNRSFQSVLPAFTVCVYCM